MKIKKTLTCELDGQNVTFYLTDENYIVYSLPLIKHLQGSYVLPSKDNLLVTTYRGLKNTKRVKNKVVKRFIEIK
jgi:hypothetical protein